MITIVAYESSWPEEFAMTGRRLRLALGSLALRIDHIGSTAVPGLAAKDRIDIQVTVNSPSPAVKASLQNAGYDWLERTTQDHVPPEYVSDDDQWGKWLFNPSDPEQAVNIHVRRQARANQRYPLLFRDYLRTHPKIAMAYAQVKQALVAHQIDNADAYYAVKDPVCDVIIGGAEAWAATTGWELGPSDC